MPQVKTKLFEILQNSLTSIILLFFIFILSHIFFIQQYGFLENNFSDNYIYLIVLNIILILITAFTLKEQVLQVLLIIDIVVLIVFLAVVWFLMAWIGGVKIF